MMEATKTIVLDAVIDWNGTSISKLDLREPTAGEMLKAIKAGALAIEQSMMLIGLVTGLSPQIVHMLPWHVFQEADQFLSGFQTSSPATGAN
jgi:hypothetical protein